ncbi:MAG: hypothetical protein JW953_07735 [Anaerolineae bacterium]|nr:hypothetical protein [Anaerolineae bacterium]
MTLNEERMQILKMLEQDIITVDEAAQLLAALETGTAKERTALPPSTVDKAKWLRVRVTNQQTGKPKVTVNVPVSLVNVALKIGAGFVPELEQMDSEQVMAAIEAIKSGAHGKIVDVEDDEGGERVEVFVE